jgi:Ca2+-binding EF-hand superfamily protein
VYPFSKLVTQQDRDTVASIRGAVARTSKIASHVSKWSSVDAADLAKMHWIHSSELALGSEFPHAVAKKYPRLMPTKHDLSVKRYVILTDEALFLTWYAPRKRKSGSSSASKDAEDEIIAELIKNYDKDGSGGLDIVEVSQFLQEAGGGRVPTHDELLWVMKTATPQRIKKNHDLLGKQELRIEHLRAAALAYSEYRQREAELDEIFDKYDDDDNGVLDRSELTNIVTDYLTETDQTKSSLEALSDEQRKLKDTRPERVKIMVEKLLQASVSIKEDVITKPEMIKALVMIQNEGKSVDPEVEDERSSVVIKMCVTLDTSKNTAHETRSEKSFKEAVKKAAYDVCGFTTGSSEVQVATSQEGEQKQGISSFEEVFAAAEAGALPRAVAGAEGSTISARDFNVSVHIPYTEKLHDDNAIAEVFTCSSFQLHFTVIVQGDLQSISNFKLSKRKLSKRLQDAGWSAKHIEETFSYFPNAFQVSDVLPLTEMVTPLVVDRMARTSRNKGLAAITNRVWKSLKSFWRTRSKMTPVALTVRLSLPMKAHNLNKTLRTELVQATCDALNAAAKSQMVLEPSRVQIRNVKSIASLMPPVNDQETPSAANQEEFEYKWDLFISYRVTSDSDLVEKLYDKITKAHPTMKVFLDKCELVLGESWGQGFADAITHSRVVVLVMSRGTFSCSHGKTCAKCPNNISRLEQSPEAEDNVILEYDLALELFEMGRVKRIVPLLVGDLEDDNRLGKMYLDFFNQFRPCLCWDAIPDKKASAIQKRACHMLSKNPELKVQLDASKDRNLANKKLREGIPSLLRGRTVKQTLHAITCMQGIKLVGLPDSTISEACKRLGDTAWDLHLLDENKEVEYYHGPKMDHTSVEILVDAFHKSHMHQQVTRRSSLLLPSRRLSHLSTSPPLLCLASDPFCPTPIWLSSWIWKRLWKNATCRTSCMRKGRTRRSRCTNR